MGISLSLIVLKGLILNSSENILVDEKFMIDSNKSELTYGFLVKII